MKMIFGDLNLTDINSIKKTTKLVSFELCSIESIVSTLKAPSAYKSKSVMCKNEINLLNY